MRRPRHCAARRGTVLPLMAVSTTVLLAIVALAIDLGWVVAVKTELQGAADSAAAAGAHRWHRPPPGETLDQRRAAVEAIARKYAGYNHPNQGTIVGPSDVVLGNWKDQTRVFTPDGTPINAVRVVTRRSAATGNPVRLFFGSVVGVTEISVTVEAIAVLTPEYGARFLIDDEMFDADEPAIEALKDRLPGTPVENFLTDRNADLFIDLYDYLPATDKRIKMRTGQVGDEALFDTAANVGKPLPQFPFGPDTTPTLSNFLRFNKSGSPAPWAHSRAVENKTTPELEGVGRYNLAHKFSELPDPHFIHVSPVFKSDLNSSDSVGYPAAKGVAGAKDERRGLVAFKILSVEPDYRGGAYLPNLWIEVVDPRTVDLSKVRPYKPGQKVGVRLVR